MALYKLDEYNLNYNDEIFDGNDIKNFDVYADDDRVGSVVNILVDENDGRFRYFIIDNVGSPLSHPLPPTPFELSP